MIRAENEINEHDSMPIDQEAVSESLQEIFEAKTINNMVYYMSDDEEQPGDEEDYSRFIPG